METPAQILKRLAEECHAGAPLLEFIDSLRTREIQLEEDTAKLESLKEREAIRRSEPDVFRRV